MRVALAIRYHGVSLSGRSKLDDQSAGDDDGQTNPGGHRDFFLEDEMAEEDADHGKDRDIDPEKLGEIPFNLVDDDPVSAEQEEASDHKGRALHAQTLADKRVATRLKKSGQNEDEPGEGSHGTGGVVVILP